MRLKELIVCFHVVENREVARELRINIFSLSNVRMYILKNYHKKGWRNGLTIKRHFSSYYFLMGSNWGVPNCDPEIMGGGGTTPPHTHWLGVACTLLYTLQQEFKDLKVRLFLAKRKNQKPITYRKDEAKKIKVLKNHNKRLIYTTPLPSKNWKRKVDSSLDLQKENVHKFKCL